jgi:hypothetical protein
VKSDFYHKCNLRQKCPESRYQRKYWLVWRSEEHPLHLKDGEHHSLHLGFVVLETRWLIHLDSEEMVIEPNSYFSSHLLNIANFFYIRFSQLGPSSKVPPKKKM